MLLTVFPVNSVVRPPVPVENPYNPPSWMSPPLAVPAELPSPALSTMAEAEVSLVLMAWLTLRLPVCVATAMVPLPEIPVLLPTEPTVSAFASV